MAALTAAAAAAMTWAVAGAMALTAATEVASAHPSLATAAISDPGPPAAATDPDARPVVRLRVLNQFKPEDSLFAQIVEGRLIADLADMETFRTVAADSPGQFLLTVSIRDLGLAAGEVQRSTRDAESGSTPRTEGRLTVTMDLDLRLEDASGKELYTGRMTAQGTHEMETSRDQALAPARQEMIDRAAQKLERLIRKRLKKL